nr:clumping factor B-like [Lytechinus pictus]
MVKTRAQRELGVTTPSPRTSEIVKTRKRIGQKSNDGTRLTQMSRSGTEAKSERKIVRSKASKKRLSTRLAIKQVDKEEEDEDDVVGCHSNLNSGEDDAIHQKSDSTERDGEQARGEQEDEDSDEDEVIEEQEDETMEDSEKDKETGKDEGEEEDDSESESDATDSDDASSPKPHADKRMMTSQSKESNTEVDDDGDDDDDDDDDDAPQDVSFSTSRQEALDSISQALQQTKKLEERAKEKRRNRDKFLKLQKERKKISLGQSRLPEDFLSEVARIPDSQPPLPSVTTQAQQNPQRDSHHKVFDSDGEMDFDEGDDFLPLSADEPKMVEGFEVHAISRQKRAPPPKSDMALDFLQQQMYGGQIKRESALKHKAKLLKRQGKPSHAFHNPKEKRRKNRNKRSIRAGETSQ